MILLDRIAKIEEIGGKAYHLFAMQMKNKPKLYVVPSSFLTRLNGCENLRNELQEELQKTLKDGGMYAVRSSAIDEDSENASFAGVHESYLNIPKNAVLEHILKVQESAYSPRAVEYRKMKGLSAEKEDIKIAVIVQEMVSADFAGVAFTINPVTDNPDETVISVTKGLGDKLVDGSVAGTTYTLTGGAVKVSGEDILNKKQLENVVKLTQEIAKKTQSFQDIEFAIKGNKVYFLQARAVASYAGINPHERSMFIDNANIIESYFGVTSPLTYTFAKDVYRDVYTASLRLGKVREKILNALAPSLSEMLYYHEGKIYYNMRSWYHVNSVFPFKKSSSYMEGMMGVKSSASQIKRVKMNAWDMLKLGVLFLQKLFNIDKLSDDFERNFERIVRPYYGREIHGTNEELYALFKSIEKDIVKEFAIPVINDCAVMIYFGMLKERAKKLGITQEELNAYISNQGDVKSAGSAKDLVEIIKIIQADEEMRKDFISMPETALAEKYEKHDAIAPILEKYRLAYGARVRDELKLETTTMIEDKAMLYALIKENLSVEISQPAYAEIIVPKRIRKLTEKTKKYIKNRECLRLYRTYVYSVVRNIFLGYGRNYVRAGRLDKADDIFYLTKKEVFTGESENGEDFKTLVAQRKAEAKSNAQKPIYNRVVFFGDKAMLVKSGNAGNGLKGIPSGNGVVTAHVSLMDTPSDVLKQGNIILTKRTDPGWIGLFPKASGLIVEHGSMLSHSFVVARELNLPAVVGVEQATSLIPNGALVTLDGLKGEIIIENETAKD